MKLAARPNPDLTDKELALIRFLCMEVRSVRVRRHVTTRRTVLAMVAATRERLRRELEAQLADPIQVWDNGEVRWVELCDAIRYRMNRAEKRFDVHWVDQRLGWVTEPDTPVSMAPLLCSGRWRRTVLDSVKCQAQEELFMELAMGGVDTTRPAAITLIEWVCRMAWNGFGDMARLRASGLSTKTARARLRDAVGIDPELIDLGRRCCLPARRVFLTQHWLTFVWQNEVLLRRIQAQTPKLLAPAATLLFKRGVPKDCDPVKALAMWFRTRGVETAGFRLLAQRSIRPFRGVIRRWPLAQGLDALLLALRHSVTPNGAMPWRPAMYRALYDQFEPAKLPKELLLELAGVPALFVDRARIEAERRVDWPAFEEFLRIEFVPVARWLQATTSEHTPSVPGGWSGWVRRANAYWERARAEEANIRWASRLSEWRCGDTHIKALTSSLQLLIEGQELRHCIHDHVDDCLAGTLRVFRAESSVTRRDRATIGLQWDGVEWSVWDVRGRCNRRMCGEWPRIAGELAAHYNSLPAQPPRPQSRRIHCATLLMDGRAVQPRDIK